MERNMISTARDRRAARPVFRSFLDGVVLLALAALLLTVQVTPADPLSAEAGAADPQPARASIFPSIEPARKPPASAATPARTCSQEDGVLMEVEVLRDDAEGLVLLVRREQPCESRRPV